jgi:LL-diaminopimelate aminotransferase
MAIEVAKRLKQLPPYIFVEVDRLKQAAIAKGADVINFGIGDPDLPTPKPIVAELARSAKDAANHQYPSGAGMLKLREAVADYYRRRFGVKLDPQGEVTTLIGSKEGVAGVAGAFINPGETVAFPDPGYPVYHTGTLYAGGKSYRILLDEKNDFLPDLEKLPASVLSRWKVLWVNYPHSPSARVAPKSYLQKLVWLAKKHGFYICSDNAYVDIYFDGEKPPSLLEIPGAGKLAMEFYSCSKSFNMTGWRLAFAVGNKDMVDALRTYKSNLDSGQFQAVQYAGIEAFRNAEKYIAANNNIYQRRRDLLVGGLNDLGWNLPMPKATFYLWAKTRGGLDSMSMTKKLIKECAIVTTPGVGLGSKSDDRIRFTLTTTEDRIKQALQRLAKAKI